MLTLEFEHLSFLECPKTSFRFDHAWILDT